MADLNPEYLTNVITSNWAMPPETLFDSAILPPGSSEAWPLPLLRSLADLSAITALDDNLKERAGATFTRARGFLSNLCIARVEALGDYELAVEIGAGDMNEGDVEVVIGLLGGRGEEKERDVESEHEEDEDEQVKEWEKEMELTEEDDETLKQWEKDMELAAARDRKRRAIARPRRISAPAPDFPQRPTSSVEEEDILDTLPDPTPEDDFTPLPSPILRLQTPRQEDSSSRTVSRVSRRSPSLSLSHDAYRPSPNTHPSSPSWGDGFIADSDTEPADASPGIFASVAYPPGTSDSGTVDDAVHTVSHVVVERRRRDREYRNWQLEMKELRTQQAWDEKEMKICRLKRKIHAIEDEREDEELLREEKRRKRG